MIFLFGCLRLKAVVGETVVFRPLFGQSSPLYLASKNRGQPCILMEVEEKCICISLYIICYYVYIYLHTHIYTYIWTYRGTWVCTDTMYIRAGHYWWLMLSVILCNKSNVINLRLGMAHAGQYSCFKYSVKGQMMPLIGRGNDVSHDNLLAIFIKWWSQSAIHLEWAAPPNLCHIIYTTSLTLKGVLWLRQRMFSLQLGKVGCNSRVDFFTCMV